MVNPMNIYIIPLVDEIWSQPLRETGHIMNRLVNRNGAVIEKRMGELTREHHMVKNVV